jgi:hypothetical protein
MELALTMGGLCVVRFGVTTGIYLRTSGDSAKDQVYVSTVIDLEFFYFFIRKFSSLFFEPKFWKPWFVPENARGPIAAPRNLSLKRFSETNISPFPRLCGSG